jgi:hypothetical protein
VCSSHFRLIDEDKSLGGAQVLIAFLESYFSPMLCLVSAWFILRQLTSRSAIQLSGAKTKTRRAIIIIIMLFFYAGKKGELCQILCRSVHYFVRD